LVVADTVGMERRAPCCLYKCARFAFRVYGTYEPNVSV
jgi:hypothetical protein